MPFSYKIDKQRRLVMSTAAGVLSKADVLWHQDQLLKDPDFDPSFSQLSDLTHVTGFDVTAAGMREMAARTIFSSESRRAVIVNNELGYGLSRMFEILRESKGERGIRVFRNLEEALDWMVRKGESAPNC
jgi:ATP phosphoribosyltransferase regulatory subunit HisZ